MKRKKFKNSIYLIIDALRYDIAFNKKLFPTLYKVAKKGSYNKVIANACSTQFVLPSIFSSTYPLDNGGYNFGIRDRKLSYIEAIKKKLKRKTILISSCNAMGIGNSYDRGFDEILTTFDFRLLIEQKINRTLIHEINLYQKKIISKAEIIKIIKKEFLITLNQVEKYYHSYNKSLWPRKLYKINKFIYEQSKIEKKILISHPFKVIEKIIKVPGGVYWLTLGKYEYKNMSFFYERIKAAFIWRSKKIIGNQRLWPFYFQGHHQVLLDEILNKVCNKITQIKNTEWHIHMHIMDLHDARSINRFLHLLCRFKFFFPWLAERLKGNIKHKFIYASSLMYIDKCLKILLDHIENEKIYKETLLLITSDHGSDYAESPRQKVSVGERNHYEYIDIPLILSQKYHKKIKRNICDSMGMTATFLDMLNIPLDKSFKGQSLYSTGKDYVISENAGSGNADIKRKDIFFTITTLNFKMMLFLKNKTLKVTKLFKLSEDPKELINLVAQENDSIKLKKTIIKLANILFKERKELFKYRGINKLSDCFEI